MGNIVFSQAAKFLQKRRNTRRWIAVVLCLALVVTSGTFGVLTRHGSALTGAEQILDCAYEGHVHGEECYNEAGELICGYADYCVHEHNESCYDGEDNLVCQLPEIPAHVHDESCYVEEEQLICEMEENEIHQHTDDCYDIELGDMVCGMEEHVHDDSCYELITEGEEIPENGEAAQGGESAGSEEPTQSEEPAGSEAPVQNEEPAGNADAAQSEEPDGSEESTQSTEPAGNEEPVQSTEPAESAVPQSETSSEGTEAAQSEAPAESVEASQSETPAESTEPAGDGINECAENRRLICEKEEHIHGNECYNQNKVLKCGKEEGIHTHNEKCYEMKRVAKCGKLELHTHSEECYTDGVLTCGKLELTEHVHGEECFREAPVMELTATAGDVTITVSANEEGIIPAGAELSVTPVVKAEAETLDNLESEEERAEAEALNAVYDEIQQGLEASMEEDETKEIKHFLAYDISFHTQNEDGESEEVKLNGDVNVTLEFPQGALPEEIISDENTQIESVDVLDIKETEEGRVAETQDAVINTTQDTDVEKVETTLSDSSTLAIAWIGEINPDGQYVYEDDDVIITVSALDEGAIPENAKLKVVPIIASEETGEQYQQVAEKLMEKAESEVYDIAGFLAYDISFVDEEGNKIEPNGEVKVTMNYKEAKIPAEVDGATYTFANEEASEGTEGGTATEAELNVKMMHLEEDVEGSINVVDMAEQDKVTALETTEEQKIQNAEFVTGGFSVFTITWTWDPSSPYVYDGEEVRITVTAVDKDAIPKGTTLSITPIKAGDSNTEEQYQDVARKLMGKAVEETYDIAGFVAYDISLIGADGIEIEPNGKVKVTIEYMQPMAVVEIDPETYVLVKQEFAVDEEEAGTDVEGSFVSSGPQVDAEDSVVTPEPQVNEEPVVTPEPQVNEEPVVTPGPQVNEEPVVTPKTPVYGEEYSETTQNITISESREMPENDLSGQESGVDVTVMHLEEDGNGGVTVVDMVASEDVTVLEVTEEQEVQKTEFITESFSTYTITWTYNDKSRSRNVKLVDGEGTELDSGNNTTLSVNNGWQKIEDIVTNAGLDTIINNKDGAKYRFKEAYYRNSQYKIGQLKYNAKKLLYRSSASGDGYEISSDYNIYLAYEFVEPAEQLQTVDTIDNNKYGIKMWMVDYDGRANGLMNDSKGEIGGYGAGYVKQGLVEPNLENGYPKVVRNQQNLSSLFEKKDDNLVNNLFIQDIYDKTGYFVYSCFDNYAYLDQNTRNFIVYQQIGTPTNGSGYFYERGNFLPYNKIEAGKFSTHTNQYDGDGNPLSEYDENGNKTRKGEKLYKAQGTVNFHFGMNMEATFMQPENGKVVHKYNGTETISDMEYRFNGDDDLWVFVDDVLVLDIGGIHDAHSGYINFATGAVHVECIDSSKNNQNTTIKAMFKAAGVFPDGSEWKELEEGANEEKRLEYEKKINEYFKGDTFVDYSTHTLKMFYMERGEGASNLHMMMNIPTIPEGTIEVEKKLSNTDKEKYSDVEFAFQVWAQKPTDEVDKLGNVIYDENEYVLLDKAYYAGTDTAVPFKETETFGSNSYQKVFHLKPDEVAQFRDLKDNRKYYVVELGVKSAEYDIVNINTTKMELVDKDGNKQVSDNFEWIDGEDGTKLTNIKSDKELVSKRPKVAYINSCSAANSKELRITKELPGSDQNEKDTFAFEVKLGGELYTGSYYLQDKEGKYYHYVEEGDKKKLELTSDDEGKKNGVKSQVCDTTSNGIITGVPAGYTVSITQILSDTEFEVREVSLDTNKYELQSIVIKENTYTPVDADTSVDADNSTEMKAIGKILLGYDAEVIVTNSYRQLYTWEIIKTSSNKGEGGIRVLLENAEFELVKMVKSDQTWVEATEGERKVYSGLSDGNGIINWKDGTEAVSFIPQGTYKLKETKAPLGYSLNEGEEWLITIKQDGEASVEGIPENDERIKRDQMSDGKTKITFYYENTPVYALPSTGGEGIYWYSIGGMLMMCAAVLILYRNKNKKVRGCRRA